MSKKNAFLPYIVIGAIIVIAVILFFVFIPGQGNDNGEVKIETAEYINQLSQHELNEAQQLLFDSVKEDLNNDPNNFESISYLADVFYHVEDYETAEEIYLKVLKYEPSNTVTLQNLANTYRNMQDYQSSEETFYRLLDFNILWMPAYEILLELYRFDLRPANEQYISYIQNGRELDVDDQFERNLLRMLAFYYKYQDDNANALKYFAEYIEKFPEDVEIKDVYNELKN